MNPITAKNIHRHELIDLNVEIITSTDNNQIGLTGSIIDESHHMLLIEPVLSSEHKNKQRISVIKKNCSFRFTLPSGEKVDIDGCLLDSKSENRLKNIVRKRW
ncbi:MAG: ribonuclease P protein component 1 [Candidatus Thorarchaeota archaeon]